MVAATTYVKTRRFLSDQKTMMKSNLKKSVMTSFQLRHHYYVTEKRHPNNVTRFFLLGPS